MKSVPNFVSIFHLILTSSLYQLAQHHLKLFGKPSSPREVFRPVRHYLVMFLFFIGFICIDNNVSVSSIRKTNLFETAMLYTFSWNGFIPHFSREQNLYLQYNVWTNLRVFWSLVCFLLARIDTAILEVRLSINIYICPFEVFKVIYNIWSYSVQLKFVEYQNSSLWAVIFFIRL